MNKTAALERLSNLESEAAELRKIIEQPEEVGLWEPACHQAQYSVWGDGSTDEVRGDSSVLQRNLIAHGNCFKTEAIARKASQLQRVHNHVMRAAFQADPDAGEWSDERCVLVFKSGKLWHSTMMGIPVGDICVHTTEQAKEACRLLNAWQAKEDAK
jgi:hypothetical protein